LALAAIAGIKQGVAMYKDAKAAGTDLKKTLSAKSLTRPKPNR
jgi:hypothetical protein